MITTPSDAVGEPAARQDDLARGLSQAEADRRREQFGPNEIPPIPPESWRSRLRRQFQSPLIAILLFALIVDLGLWIHAGRLDFPIESLVIALILALNAGLGVLQEFRSERALARLRSLASPQTWVWRDSVLVRRPSAELTPGDLIRLQSGDRAPADGIARRVNSALVDESTLTGESTPVAKSVGDEIQCGGLMARGWVELEVLRIGRDSAMGQIATMLSAVEAGRTPLERRLDQFGQQVARWIVALTALLLVGGLIAEGPNQFGTIFLFAVALAVAAVPEALPAAVTLTLAIGVERLAERQAVVRRLAAVEALGSVTVIATDKTGTLTENQLRVRRLDAPSTDRALRALALALDGAGGAHDDPLDLALATFVRESGVDPAALQARCPRHSSRPFDSAWTFSRVTVNEADGLVSYFKGAPEALIDRASLASDERAAWLEKAEAYAGEGFRVLAVATGLGEAERDLTLLGLVLFWDPPRPEVPAAARQALAAGIRVVMLTGDHPSTALAVARGIGLEVDRVVTGRELAHADDATARAMIADVNVFARVLPADKLRIVETLQANGAIVAVTGDGVNDSPALKRADIGVAMGRRGSDVARDVADVVLLDDNFGSIVAAIEGGRSIYANIKSFIRYVFAANLAEIILVTVGAVGATVFGLREANGALLLPLTAAQILWINFITDGLPALALAIARNQSAMNQPPRPPDEPLLDRPSLRYIVGAGALLGGIGLLALVWAPQFGLSVEATRSAVFQFITLGKLLLVYPSRFVRHWRSETPLHLAVGGGIVLQVVAGSAPLFQTALHLTPLALEIWLVVAVAATLAGIVGFGIAAWANRQPITLGPSRRITSG